MPNNEDKKQLRCSFCGKPQEKVQRMIAGPGVCICNECVELCQAVLDDEPTVAQRRPVQEEIEITIPKPGEIKHFLDEYVVGQDAAKKALSVAVYNHYKRIYFGGDGGVELQKSNVMLLGPTGGRKHPQQEFIQIDTSNILFICGGAFEGLESIIEKRTDNSSLGFGGQLRESKEVRTQKLLKKVVPHDLVRFGLIPELVGRIPVIATLDPLDEEALVKILVEPKNSLVKQYQRLFELDGVEISFTPEALRAVAQKAIQRKTGARGLRGILEGVLGELMFQTPSDATIDRILVGEGCVTGEGEPEFHHNALKKPVRLTLGPAPAPARQKRNSVS